MNGHEEIVRRLLEFGVNREEKDFEGRTALSWASEKGHESTVRALLENMGNPTYTCDSKGRSPLSYAVINGHKGVVDLFLQFGAHPDAMELGGTALYQAWENGHELIFQLLLDHVAERIWGLLLNEL